MSAEHKPYNEKSVAGSSPVMRGDSPLVAGSSGDGSSPSPSGVPSPHSVLSDVRDALAAPRGDVGVKARMLALDSVQRLVEQLERRDLALKQIAGLDGYGGHLAPEDSEYLAREALKDA